MIEPYTFVRAVTMGLGATWGAMGIVRSVRTARSWRARMELLAVDERWWRRQIALAALRVTVLDPLNLALLCLLAGLWSLPL